MDKRGKQILLFSLVSLVAVALFAVLILNSIFALVTPARLNVSLQGQSSAGILTIVEDAPTILNFSVVEANTTQALVDGNAVRNITGINVTLPEGVVFANYTGLAVSAIGANFSSLYDFTNTTITSSTVILNFMNKSFDSPLLINGTNQSFWFNVTVATPGRYNITVNVSYGNVWNSTNVTLNVSDITAPSITINLQNNSNLTGAADEFNVTIIDYAINFSGVFAALKNSTGYYSLSGSNITEGMDYTNWTNLSRFNSTRYSNNISSNNLADGYYILYVNATDNATNNATAPIINITIDNTAPTAINLVQPANVTVSTNRTPTLKWEPTTDLTFVNYTMQIDDTLDFSSIINMTGTYSNTTNITGVTGTTLGTDATYYWRVTAWDEVGQSAVTPKFIYITDNTAPAVKINLLNNSNLTGAADGFNVNITETNKNLTGVFAAIKNSTGYYSLSGSNITDGKDYTNWTNLPSFNATTYTNNISSNNFADGSYLLYVNATDNATNNGTAVAINITIDNTNPNVSIINPDNATSTTTALQLFQCNASDASEVTNITFYLYDSSNSSFVNITVNNASGVFNQSNFSYTIPYTGTFLWNCRANDTLNNTGWAGSNRTITINAVPAAVTSSGGGGGGTAPGITYDSGVLTASITKELKMGDTAKFTVEGASHTVRIMGLTASTASVQIKSILITKLLALRAPAEEVDTDNDGVNELSLKLESISLSSSKVNITITPLVGAVITPAQPETNETKPETPSDEEPTVVPPTTTSAPTTGTGKTGLIVAILLISSVAIIIGVVLLKKANKPIWKLWT